MVEMTKKDAPIEPLEKYNYNPENDPKSPYYKGPKRLYKTFHDF